MSAERLAWAVENLGAQVVPEDTHWLSVYGPTVIPFRSMSGGDGHPHHPGLYGRYLVIDLTENNRASIDEWCERNPDKPRPDLGFGVCQHGFGLQSFSDRGRMSEAVATARAQALNALTVWLTHNP